MKTTILVGTNSIKCVSNKYIGVIVIKTGDSNCFVLYVKPKVKPKSELFLLVHKSKYKEKSPIITVNRAIYGTLMELLTRFELVTSSLPRKQKHSNIGV